MERQLNTKHMSGGHSGEGLIFGSERSSYENIPLGRSSSLDWEIPVDGYQHTVKIYEATDIKLLVDEAWDEIAPVVMAFFDERFDWKDYFIELKTNKDTKIPPTSPDEFHHLRANYHFYRELESRMARENGGFSQALHSLLNEAKGKADKCMAANIEKADRRFRQKGIEYDVLKLYTKMLTAAVYGQKVRKVFKNFVHNNTTRNLGRKKQEVFFDQMEIFPCSRGNPYQDIDICEFLDKHLDQGEAAVVKARMNGATLSDTLEDQDVQDALMGKPYVMLNCKRAEFDLIKCFSSTRQYLLVQYVETIKPKIREVTTVQGIRYVEVNALAKLKNVAGDLEGKIF